jgi:hypothetical protein
MTPKQFDIFLAAFFSDWEKLDRLLETQEDLELTVEFTGGYLFSYPEKFNFSVPDIIQMNIDCWYSIRDKKELINTPDINPAKFYRQSKKCLRNLKKRFPEFRFSPVDYTKNLDLVTGLMEDEEFIDYNEYNEYNKEGYREIDLDLINYAVRRNVKKVVQLLKKGANPVIDPFDKTSEAVVPIRLAGDDSLHFNNIYPVHLKRISHGYGIFIIKDCEWMIANLYGSASSAKVYDTIERIWGRL